MLTMSSSTSLIFPLEIAKAFFFVAYVAATIGVTVGVYWENEQFPKEKQHRGWLLLVRSLAADTLLTVLIFGTDGWISHIQRSEIAEALDRAVRAETVLAEYRKPRHLSQQQRDRIASAIKAFPAVSFIAMTNAEAERWNLALEISQTLRAAGWNWEAYDGSGSGMQAIDGSPSEGLTVADHIEIQAPPALGEVAGALAEAIKDPDVMGMERVVLTVDKRVPRMIVIVGSKK
jgi:hypothetical protein